MPLTSFVPCRYPTWGGAGGATGVVSTRKATGRASRHGSLSRGSFIAGSKQARAFRIWQHSGRSPRGRGRADREREATWRVKLYETSKGSSRGGSREISESSTSSSGASERKKSRSHRNRGARLRRFDCNKNRKYTPTYRKRRRERQLSSWLIQEDDVALVLLFRDPSTNCRNRFKPDIPCS